MLSILWQWPLTSATTRGHVQHVGVSWQEPPVPGVIWWQSIPSLMALGCALPTWWVQCKGVPWQEILCSSILTETGVLWWNIPRPMALRGKVAFVGKLTSARLSFVAKSPSGAKSPFQAKSYSLVESPFLAKALFAAKLTSVSLCGKVAFLGNITSAARLPSLATLLYLVKLPYSAKLPSIAKLPSSASW